MSTVAEVLAWQPALLEQIGDGMVGARRQLVGLEDELAAGRPPSDWEGDDATAARRTHRLLTVRLHDLVAEVSALARSIGVAAAGVEAARRSVTHAVSQAEGAGFFVDPASGAVLDPAVAPPDPALADDRARLREELAARIEEGMRAAHHSDAALARVLGLVASSLLDGGNDSLADAAARGRSAGRRDSLPMPSTGDPGRVHGWWKGLSPGERRRFLRDFPELIGNADGIPMARRDEANRRFLPLALDRLRDQLRRSESMNDFERIVVQMPSPKVLRTKIADLEAIRAAVRQPGTALLSLGIRGKRFVTADIAVGNVHRADTVTHSVHGVGTRPATRVDDKMRAARDLLAQKQQISEQAGEERTHAVIMSMGYEAPQLDLTDLTDEERQFFRDTVAKDAAPGMADFLTSIDTTRRSDPHLTLDGHSYGSVVSGEVLKHDTGIDAFVASGAPGVGVDDVTELKVPRGNVHNIEAKGDHIADLGYFGRDLTYLEGVRQLDTTAHPELGLSANEGHTSYHDRDTTSLYNIAAVGADHPDLAIDDTRGPDLADRGREGVRRVVETTRGAVAEARDFVDDRIADGLRLLDQVRR